MTTTTTTISNELRVAVDYLTQHQQIMFYNIDKVIKISVASTSSKFKRLKVKLKKNLRL